MIFEIDRNSVTEGDIVEIRWQCEGAEMVKLVIDNGFRSTEIPLETNGTKRFRLNRSKGKTHLTIAVTINGKIHRKTIKVRVKKIPTVKADTVDSNGKKMHLPSQWWQKMLTNWHAFTAKARMALNTLPERKQGALKMLALIGTLLIIASIWPSLYSAVIIVLIIYNIIVLLRK